MWPGGPSRSASNRRSSIARRPTMTDASSASFPISIRKSQLRGSAAILWFRYHISSVQTTSASDPKRTFSRLAKPIWQLPVRQRLNGGSMYHAAVERENGAMAGTIPGSVRVVPRHGAALVGASRGDGVGHPFVAFPRCDLASAKIITARRLARCRRGYAQCWLRRHS